MRLPSAPVAWAARLARLLSTGAADSRKRRWIATGLTVASLVMIAVAAWLFAYPFYTDLRAGNRQEDLRTQIATGAFKSDFEEGTIGEGDPLTRIVISRIGLDAVVVEGTSQRALAAGMGHYLNTPLPGEVGNVAIAGHRTMNGRAFGDLDKLRPGDRIELITPIAHHTYEVLPPFGDHANPWVVAPNDWTVTDQTQERWLTLTTCHPRGSNKQRLVARAQWVASEERT